MMSNYLGRWREERRETGTKEASREKLGAAQDQLADDGSANYFASSVPPLLRLLHLSERWTMLLFTVQDGREGGCKSFWARQLSNQTSRH